MATLNFPSNPSVDDEYTFSGKTWKWNGDGWEKVGAGGATGATGPAGATGPVGDYVESFNGVTGAVTTNAMTLHVAGISSDGGATFDGPVNITDTLDVSGTVAMTGIVYAEWFAIGSATAASDNYTFPIDTGTTGDVLMVKDNGDLDFTPINFSTTFVIDSDVPLATGIRYTSLYLVPYNNASITDFVIRSNDQAVSGVGTSLSITLKSIQSKSDLNSASPSIYSSVQYVSIAKGSGDYTSTLSGLDLPIGSDNNIEYLVVEVTSNAGNHTDVAVSLRMEARNT
jgi:hypothetical protein